LKINLIYIQHFAARVQKMQMELFNFESDKLLATDIEKIPANFAQNFNDETLSDKHFQRQLNNLPLSADQKLLVSKMADFTISAGNMILRIGRKILELTFNFLKKYPATSFGLVVGIVISSFIPTGVVNGFAIPVVASFLGLLKKVIILFALGAGFKEDIRDSALASKVAVATSNIRKSLEV
jgi:hypothetical protein